MIWPIVQFDEVAEIVTGNTPPKNDSSNYGSGVPWVKPPDLDAWEAITKTVDTLSPAGQKTARLIPAGSVMVSCIGSIGRVGIAGTTVATNQQINSLIFNSSIDPMFGYYYCRYKKKLINSLARNAVVPILNKSNFSKITIPVPPLSEQRRIISILDQSRSLMRKREEVDKNMLELLPALFYDMFGDPANNDKKWSHITIRELVEKIERFNPINLHGSSFKYVDITGIDGYMGRVANHKTITREDAPSRARQVIRLNDVLISTVRPYLKATALVPANLNNEICSTGFCVLRSKKTIGFGFLYALSRLRWFTETLNNIARGASYPAVSDNDILNLRVPYPTDLQLHKKFDTIVLDIQKQMEMQQINTNNVVTLFDLLLHSAFSGNLTANWRDTHLSELLSEMDSHSSELKLKLNKPTVPNVLSFPNPLFEKKAILIAYIVFKSLGAKHKIARVKLAKLYYFVNQLMENPIAQDFIAKAAGPLDNDIYPALELAQSHKWIVIEPKMGNEKPFSAGVCIDDVEALAFDLLGHAKTNVDQFLETTKEWGYETLERWATVHFVAKTLILENKLTTVKNIKSSIQSCPEWHSKLQREAFSDEFLERTIAGLTAYGLITIPRELL